MNVVVVGKKTVLVERARDREGEASTFREFPKSRSIRAPREDHPLGTWPKRPLLGESEKKITRRHEGRGVRKKKLSSQRRVERHGAFREDRFLATAIDADERLHRHNQPRILRGAATLGVIKGC